MFKMVTNYFLFHNESYLSKKSYCYATRKGEVAVNRKQITIFID